MNDFVTKILPYPTLSYDCKIQQPHNVISEYPSHINHAHFYQNMSHHYIVSGIDDMNRRYVSFALEICDNLRSDHKYSIIYTFWERYTDSDIVIICNGQSYNINNTLQSNICPSWIFNHIHNSIIANNNSNDKLMYLFKLVCLPGYPTVTVKAMNNNFAHAIYLSYLPQYTGYQNIEQKIQNYINVPHSWNVRLCRPTLTKEQLYQVIHDSCTHVIHTRNKYIFECILKQIVIYYLI